MSLFVETVVLINLENIFLIDEELIYHFNVIIHV